jgi:hypothetical protein
VPRRIVASLSRLYPEVATSVADVVRKDFYAQLKFSKSQQPLDHRYLLFYSHLILTIFGRLRTVRYVGELVKFMQAPPIFAFKCMQALMNEFSLQNVEVLCALLENCGRCEHT